MQKFAVRLIDVSKWQYDKSKPPTLLPIVQAGFLGMLVRVGYGLVIDWAFAPFWKIAKQVKLSRIPYWYLDYYSHKGTGLTAYDWGVEQAGQCYDAVKADPGEAPLALDCEEFGGAWRITYLTRGDYNRVVKGFCEEWKRLTGKYPMIYCSLKFIWVFETWVRSLDLWLAWYTRNITKEQSIAGAREEKWQGRILIWQYTSDGDIDDDADPDGLELGMGTDALDLDGWLGTLAEFSAYCGTTPAPAPLPTPTPAPAPTPPAGTRYKVVARDGVNIRDVPKGMPGSDTIGWMPYGSIVDGKKAIAVGSDIWLKVTNWSVVAIRYNGVDLMAEV